MIVKTNGSYALCSSKYYLNPPLWTRGTVSAVCGWYSRLTCGRHADALVRVGGGRQRLGQLVHDKLVQGGALQAAGWKIFCWLLVKIFVINSPETVANLREQYL